MAGGVAAIGLAARAARADPIGFCNGDGGAVESMKALRLPIEMLSEDVTITQDAGDPWLWNVKADSRFRNHAKKALTVPILFPASRASSKR